jgi:phospholipid/cholesterol/gamma-HCH transport system ATP-binding protein
MIKIRHLTKKFDDKTILDNISLDINAGEILVIIGQSGCGKSVLLKHIIGLLKPDSGQIFVHNNDITQFSYKELYKIRKKMGMVFQNAALFDSMTIFDNVAFPLKENKINPDEIKKIVTEKLQLVNLTNIEHLLPSQLSGGMQKRVGIARAVAMNPEILLYDEPTTGLDPITSDVIDKLILNANKKLKTTSIVVSHSMSSIYKIADRIAMLHNGKIVAVDTPENIRNTDNPIVFNFINGISDAV